MRELYRHSLALLTDLYQLTMAYGYWKSGLRDREAVFHLFYRKNPFDGGFAVAAGLESVVEFVREFRFTDDDRAHMETLRGNDDRPLFDRAFLDELGELRLTCDIDAVPEGAPVFPHEPLVRVRGPILQCQLLETPLLTLTNFPTLIATKAARICMAAQGDAVIEFGLRRAQGIDGGVTAARAAFVAGCVGTSNVLAGKLFGIPVLGTHAHSWIMCFDDEPAAFHAFAEAVPNNCVFLVDTYDSHQGIRNAVAAASRLREKGHEPVGIRLDSGDLAELSIEARRLLDEAGFPDMKIVASSDLDEHRIARLKSQGARIDVWGVGTRLTTAFDDPALGGVYKLAAVRDPGRRWQHRIKLSDETVKTTLPGIHQIRRYFGPEGFIRDVIFDAEHPPERGCEFVDLDDSDRAGWISGDADFVDVLQPVFRQGQLVYDVPPLKAVRERTLQELDRLPGEVRRLESPDRYPVGLERSLHELRLNLMQHVRARRGQQ